MTMRLNQGCHVPGEVDTRYRICGAAGNHQCFTIKEMMFGSNEEFVYLQCGNCGCLQISEIPVDLARHYPANYYSFHAAEKISKSNLFRAWLEKLRCRTALFGQGVKLNRLASQFVSLPDGWHEIGPWLNIAKLVNFNDGLLDVGCGEHSWWLLKAQKCGFTKLVGVDPFIQQDKHEVGINYFKKNITELEGQFRYITFHHSLEHMPNQLAQLSTAQRLLATDGVCLVRIPLVSSFVWEKYGVDWVELDAPRHLYLHSRESIELLAEKAGLVLFHTIYDSDEFEFAASEQYRAGIPLFDERSYLVNPDRSIFSESEMVAFKEEAKRVNKECTGGRAGFFSSARNDYPREQQCFPQSLNHHPQLERMAGHTRMLAIGSENQLSQLSHTGCR